MAYLALFVALGGTSYAAVKLSRGSVKQQHIARGAVTSPKVKDRSLLARDFRPGQLPVSSPVAYAYVHANRTFDQARSKNVIGIVQGRDPGGFNDPTPGTYCFKLAVTPKSAVATSLIGRPFAVGSPVLVQAEVPPGIPTSGYVSCPAGYDSAMAMTVPIAGGNGNHIPADRPFLIVFY